MLYENINTESELIEFVEKLNEISHYDQYLLFNHVFNSRLLQLRAAGFKHTPKEFYEKWFIEVGDFAIYSTAKINIKIPIEQPELKTGLYEKFYFHIHQNDTSGISQNIP